MGFGAYSRLGRSCGREECVKRLRQEALLELVFGSHVVSMKIPKYLPIKYRKVWNLTSRFFPGCGWLCCGMKSKGRCSGQVVPQRVAPRVEDLREVWLHIVVYKEDL